MPDDLLAALRAGDANARAEAFRAEGERVWALVYRLCGDYDLAHDITQVTFLRAFRKIERYDGAGTLRGWICGIAINHLRDVLKTQRRRSVTLERFHDAEDRAVLPAARDVVLRERVARALAELSAPMREVIVMHDVEGFTHEEIAQVQGIAPGSSRARLSRARAQLRDLLADLHTEV